VGYLLRMSDEIHGWLTDLHRSDPPTAMSVAQALTALMSEGASLGPPLVSNAAESSPPEDLMAALDSSYQDRLEQMTTVRRRVAQAATLVRNLQDRLAELESAQSAEEEDAEVRRLLARMTEAERRLQVRSQRLQARIDAFRTRKEVLKARYTAARAELLIDELMTDRGPGQVGDEAATRLRDITGQIERELSRKPWPEGLMVLRPEAADAGQIRVIFALEPPGTALLIAVLEGREAVRDQYTEAITLSADVLRQARAGQAPEAAAYGYDDPRSFLEEFHPGQAAEVQAAAAALIARNRTRTLADQRTRLGFTQAEVAHRMGVRQERVSAIERAEPDATEVRTLASYIEALGGRLELIADFSGDRVLLR
jgi:phage shock protein A/DNA-binding XRE family transcriptional regulator